MLKLSITLLVLLGTCSAQNDHPLIELQGTTRVLIVFAPDASSANYKKQLALIEHHNYELTERNTIVIPVANGTRATDDHFVGENLPLATAADQATARSRFHVQPGDFLVVLLNPDGTEQIRSMTPVPFKDLVSSLGPAPKHLP
jgi:hypothetical protein